MCQPTHCGMVLTYDLTLLMVILTLLELMVLSAWLSCVEAVHSQHPLLLTVLQQSLA